MVYDNYYHGVLKRPDVWKRRKLTQVGKRNASYEGYSLGGIELLVLCFRFQLIPIELLARLSGTLERLAISDSEYRQAVTGRVLKIIRICCLRYKVGVVACLQSICLNYGPPS